MASLRRSRDRGQLILVAGLTVAVILVMLVLLLNTVIYTENLATRGIDSGGGDALEYRATVVGSVAELIERENDRYDEGHPPAVGVESGVETIDGALSKRHLERGTVAEVRFYGVGIDKSSPRIWQHEIKELPEGTVMIETNEFERFVMTVDEFAEDGDPFYVRIGDWSMALDVIAVDVENEGGTTTEERIQVTIEGEQRSVYEYPSGEVPLEIDLVEGSIETDDGSRDTDVEIPTPDDDELRYVNGDQVTGTFDLRAVGTAAEPNLTEYDGGSGEGPYYTYPVERVDLTLHYETSELRFVTEETIVAEEVEP